jgi:septum formation protein
LIDPAKLVLASRSPRRLSLLKSAGFEVQVARPEADETWPGGDAAAAVIEIAQRKLAAVGAFDWPVVAADTVVLADAPMPLGKPRDTAAACVSLASLAGRTHRVITGFAVRYRGQQRCDAVITKVHFRDLSRADIERYVATGESLDKAGAYGIQGQGGALVDWLEGSYTNVVGLPLAEVLGAIQALCGGAVAAPQKALI